MDDKDQDQGATDTATGTAGSTLGGAAAGAVAGSALGVPVVGCVWRALGCSNWRSKKADHRQGEVGGCITKKEGNDKKAIDKAKNEAGQYPQSYQEDDCQKADAESR